MSRPRPARPTADGFRRPHAEEAFVSEEEDHRCRRNFHLLLSLEMPSGSRPRVLGRTREWVLVEKVVPPRRIDQLLTLRHPARRNDHQGPRERRRRRAPAPPSRSPDRPPRCCRPDQSKASHRPERLSHRRRHLLAPGAVNLAEPRVAVNVRMLGQIDTPATAAPVSPSAASARVRSLTNRWPDACSRRHRQPETEGAPARYRPSLAGPAR